jgi:hypothetical protein
MDLKNRYVTGLEKLNFAAQQVAVMQEELTALQPELVKTSAEVDAKMAQIQIDSVEVDAKKVVVQGEEAAANEKAAAANRDDDRVDIRELLKQLDTERALSRDNAIVIVGGHKNPPLRFGNTLRDSDSLIKIFTVENNIRAVATRRLNLGITGHPRHHHPARNPGFAAR